MPDENPIAPRCGLFQTPVVKIPAKAIALLLLPFFLNDFAIIFLKVGVLPDTAMAAFYYKMPWLGNILVQWHPASVAVAPYRQILLWLQDVTVFLVFPGIFFGLYFKKKLIDWETLGLAAKPPLWDLGYGLVLALQLFLIGKFIRSVLLEVFPSWEIFYWFGYDFPETMPWQLLLVLYACLTAAFVEEMVFRGLLIPWLQSRGLNTIGAVLISSLLFAGIHWCQGPAQLSQTFAVGLITGSCFVSSRKLWPLILAHFAVDMIAFWPSS